MTQPPFDLARAHRWFAVEFNNLAWEFVEREALSPDEKEQMIHAAHASCFHWLQVGTPVNHQRAQCLLATAYAAAGLPEAAARHAERCVTLSSQSGDAQTTFDLATTCGCAARAYAAAGLRERACEWYAKAKEHAARFDDPEDRAVFEKLYPAP